MSDKEIRQVLNGLNIGELVRVQHIYGRASVPHEFRQYWAAQHAYAIEIVDDGRRGQEVRPIAELLKEITYSLAALEARPLPTYYPYTDVRILDWFIGKRRQKFIDLKSRCIEGIYFLALDVLNFEGRSLTGFETSHRERCVEPILVTRIQAIGDLVKAWSGLCRSVLGEVRELYHDPIHFAELEGYADEPTRVSGLLHLSAFPQTRFHDEVLFLRTIHVSELCFFGIRISVMEATENIRRGIAERAAECLAQAIGFADVLHKGFKVLRTMPPEHFADFRDSTGEASAIQSRNYQLMEVYLRGVNAQKQEVYKGHPHLSDLGRFAHPGFVHLGGALKACKESDAKWRKVFEVARVLDRSLLTWRGFHLAFAKLYLPPHAGGTGGTAGAPYLQRFLRSGLFEETEVDIEAVREMFPEWPELPSLFRIRSEVAIAPGEDVIAHERRS
jgi:tryptophan 2,3-dioxygenase